MRTHFCILIFSLVVAWRGTEVTPLLADDVAPGESTRSGDNSWTREEPLGDPTHRTTDEYPLSDQTNQGDWEPYLPLTDEFSEASLDEKKWLPVHPSWKGRKPAWFSSANVRNSDGQLQLIMRKEPAPRRLRSRGYHTYSSAAVHAAAPVRYGYFEVRAQPMDSAGSSSFWFAGSDDRTRTEIDVFELGGKAAGHQRRYNMNLHVFYSPDSEKHWSLGDHYNVPWRVADDFHVYGLDWNERELTYYIDGIAVRRVKNTHWHQPLSMIFDSETMPDWLGLPADEDLPSTYRIDYVRSWKSRKSNLVQKSLGTDPTTQN